MKKCAQTLVPLQFLQIHEHCARCICNICYVNTVIEATGQVPQYPRVQRTEKAFAITNCLLDAFHIVHQPFDFDGAETVAERQTTYLFDVVLLMPNLR